MVWDQWTTGDQVFVLAPEYWKTIQMSTQWWHTQKGHLQTQLWLLLVVNLSPWEEGTSTKEFHQDAL